MLHSLAENHPLTVNGRPCQFRAVTLPGAGTWWYDLNHGAWLAGGQTLHYPVAADESPLFVRDGTILFYHGGELANAHTDFHAAVELHVFSREIPAVGHYHLDDQTTRAYLTDGQHNRATLRAGRDQSGGGGFFLETTETGPLPPGATRWTPVFYGDTPETKEPAARRLTINGHSPRELTPATRRWISKSLPVLI